MRVFLAVLIVAVTFSLAAAKAPLLLGDLQNTVADEYIVILHKNASVELRDRHVADLATRFIRKDFEKVLFVYDIGDFIGYSARLTKETLKQELEHPNVQYIEVNQVVSIADETATQEGATWGIARIDQPLLPVGTTYNYWKSAGAGVTAYVIDTGILTTHNEFGGRAVWGFDAVGDGQNDGNGHGTHVAGTIGGTLYGVAKAVKLVAVKVLNAAGSGTLAGVIAGIDWVTKDHTGRGRDARSVANMSLGGGVAATLDQATTNSVAAGVNHAVAAGNNNGVSACNYSPARTPSAVTVGASTNTDARASYSNIGTCLDLFAPGSNILSSYIGSNTATNTLSGTSMATPHVAGAIAVYIGHLLEAGTNPLPPTPADVEVWLKEISTKNALSNVGTGSNNYLLFSPSSDL